MTTQTMKAEGRHETIRFWLRYFEMYLSHTAPPGYNNDGWFKEFEVLTAERFGDPEPLTAKEREDFRRAKSLGYPKSTGLVGVYLYVDVCCENDANRLPENGSEQFTVIRYIGSVTTKFDDQMRSKKNNRREIPSYRWIDIIPVRRWFFAPSLECFLIRNLSPQRNKHHKTRSRSGSPIYREW
jgi:hypothetical protein